MLVDLWEKADLEAARTGFLNPPCKYCKSTLTMSFAPSEDSGKTAHPFNVSVDRLDHLIQICDAELLRLLCQICNFVRGASTVDHGQDQVDRMKGSRAEGGAENDEDSGRLRPTRTVVKKLTQADKNAIKKTALDQWQSIESRCLRSQLPKNVEKGKRVKHNRLTREDLVESPTEW